MHPIQNYLFFYLFFIIQTISESVAAALEWYGGEEQALTANAIRKFDMWFDYMNTRNDVHAIKQIKHHRLAITDENFPAYKACMLDTINWLDEWQRNAESLTSNKADTNRLLLSAQTRRGIRISSLSGIEMIQELLERGAPMVHTSRFNQDPLEGFFGIMRSLGRRWDNPTIHQFGLNVNIIRNLKHFAPESGNCKPAYLDDTTALQPKR